jgi:dTDP-4-dehydrorhamnose 3,5-epimerase
MEQIPTALEGPLLIRPAVFSDPRGFFAETYRESDLAERFGIRDRFVQDNQSRSTRGVVRGMHFQPDPPIAKLVRCARGAILDVVVDIRPGSPTFGEWEGYRLDDERLEMLWVPAGFAHGFCVLSEVGDFAYLLSSVYDPATESQIAWDDPEVGVEWPISEPLLSERDKTAPRLSEIADRLPW